MIVIIAGCRDLPRTDTYKNDLERAINDSGFQITYVISGACGLKRADLFEEPNPSKIIFAKGADGLGEMWACDREIPFTRDYADWDGRGYSAGPERNERMATLYKAEALIALWDGASRGTFDMIKKATAHGLKVRKHYV